MIRDALNKQTHVVLAISAALVLAGCTATKPAPVVHRTKPDAQRQVATAPDAARTQAEQGRDKEQAPQQAADEATQVTPIHQGAIMDGASNSSPYDPNTKVGPQGIKRPYGKPATPAVAMAPKPAASAQPKAEAQAAPAPTQPKPATPAVPSVTRTFEGVRYSWPHAGKVTQNFDGVSNKGLMLAGKTGDPVLAAADGKVIFSGPGPRGYGNLVILKHSNEMLSVYAHNRSLAVKEGQQVKRGQKIAEIGDAGGNPGLHFEMRQGGKPVDPKGVLPQR